VELEQFLDATWWKKKRFYEFCLSSSSSSSSSSFSFAFQQTFPWWKWTKLLVPQ
jgi:fumarate reductase subunit C